MRRRTSVSAEKASISFTTEVRNRPDSCMVSIATASRVPGATRSRLPVRKLPGLVDRLGHHLALRLLAPSFWGVPQQDLRSRRQRPAAELSHRQRGPLQTTGPGGLQNIMSISFDQPNKRWRYQFDKRIAGQRVRASQLLPKGWTRAQADTFDQKESAPLYGIATGVIKPEPLISDAVLLYLKHHAPSSRASRTSGANSTSAPTSTPAAPSPTSPAIAPEHRRVACWVTCRR